MAEEIPQLTTEQQDVAKKLLGELNSGSFDQRFTAQEVVSAIKMFVDPGKNITDLFMRADFADDEMALAAARHVSKCKDFADTIGETEAHNTIAARVSIRGKRVEILLKGVTGGQAQAPKGGNGAGDWLKRKANIG